MSETIHCNSQIYNILSSECFPAIPNLSHFWEWFFSKFAFVLFVCWGQYMTESPSVEDSDDKQLS
jgi:hypothetical protein